MNSRLLACALGALLSCRTPATEIVLRVETDMPQGPGQRLTDVRVRVAPNSDATHPVLDRVFPLGVGGYPLLPADLGITPPANESGRSVDIQVTAMADGVELFTYRVIAPFEADRMNALVVFLADRCNDRTNRDQCDVSQTCGREGCDSVERTSLPRFSDDAAIVSGDAGVDVGLDATLCDAASGTCGEPCAALGLTSCGGRCTDPSTDSSNCGACGNACTAGQVCQRGTCSGCPAGLIECGGQCADTQTDTRNCGGCGHPCAAAALCNSGSCACAAGTVDCGNACVNLQTDGLHCGTCANACGAGHICVAGMCV